jgi:hypothetical protein
MLMSVSSVFLSGGTVSINADSHDTAVHSYKSGSKIVVKDDAPNGFYLTTPTWTFDAAKVSRIVFNGGNGNDRFVNDAPVPITAYGNGGNDYLQGNQLALDRLFGGSGSNTYHESFNLDHWFANNNYTATDIDQAASPTCTFLGALAGAADRVDLSAGLKETSHGVYQVRLINNGRFVYETVNFDGTWTDTDAQPGHYRDNAGQITSQLNGAFWTVIYQRAYLQLKGVNWHDQNTDHWGNSWKDGQAALYALTGWTCSTTNMSTNQSTDLAKTMQAALNHGDVLTAGTRATTSNNVVSLHVYAVESVYQMNGIWMIRVYNPWGHDGPNSATDGRDDGFVTLTWAQFTSNFNQVYRAKP